MGRDRHRRSEGIESCQRPEAKKGGPIVNIVNIVNITDILVAQLCEERVRALASRAHGVTRSPWCVRPPITGTDLAYVVCRLSLAVHLHIQRFAISVLNPRDLVSYSPWPRAPREDRLGKDREAGRDWMWDIQRSPHLQDIGVDAAACQAPR
jgi:hypothetical protein